ncbi:MAG: type VI secretion system protein TssL, long form [Pseudomonadota bacterium]
MEEQECPECEGGAGWIMTFADLMSLLMCFFVLLLSFSEMDVLKYKQVAGSMSFAFGVQREIKADEIPKGTSVIAKEFSPGKPQPTPIPEVRQVTTDEFKQNLDFTDSESKNNESKSAAASIEQLQEQLEEEAKEKAEELKEALKKEIGEGLVEITTKNEQVIIRIREKGSFTSGSAKLQKGFWPVMLRVCRALNSIDGKILVAGHTDNIPIKTKQFPSNWVLSASRAANVVHFMTSKGRISPRRVEIRAHADMAPVVSNKTRENRAKNRRVEIIVMGDPKTAKKIKEQLSKQ